MPTAYDIGLERNPANFQPLTPLSFLARAAEVSTGKLQKFKLRERAKEI